MLDLRYSTILGKSNFVYSLLISNAYNMLLGLFVVVGNLY